MRNSEEDRKTEHGYSVLVDVIFETKSNLRAGLKAVTKENVPSIVYYRVEPVRLDL